MIRLLVALSYRDADTPIYRRYGELMTSGLVPYRDFALEYPPGAAATFLPPALVTSSFSGYVLAFEALMIACALAALTCRPFSWAQRKRAATAWLERFLLPAPARAI